MITFIWIAALTADARIGLKEETLAIGANDFLVKPVGLPELRIALEKLAGHATALVAAAAVIAVAAWAAGGH